MVLFTSSPQSLDVASNATNAMSGAIVRPGGCSVTLAAGAEQDAPMRIPQRRWHEKHGIQRLRDLGNRLQPLIRWAEVRVVQGPEGKAEGRNQRQDPLPGGSA